VRGVVAGAAVHAQADRHAGVEHARTGAMPLARRMLLQGQWATPVRVAANRLMPSSSSLTQWACQTSVAQPAQVLRVLRRRAVELFAAVGDVVVVLGQVGVQPHPVAARQRADSRIRSRLTLKGEQGATATCSMAPGAASW
jgi:hypothetical protein